MRAFPNSRARARGEVMEKRDSRLRGNDVGEYGNDGESNLLRPGHNPCRKSKRQERNPCRIPAAKQPEPTPSSKDAPRGAFCYRTMGIHNLFLRKSWRNE